jgi:hypothetical protein
MIRTPKKGFVVWVTRHRQEALSTFLDGANSQYGGQEAVALEDL